MILQLRRLSATLRGPRDPAYGGRVPKRALFLAPDAAQSIVVHEAEHPRLLCYTDILRSPEASLLARRTKRGVRAPGWSGHNFGFSIDLGLKEIDRTYEEILALMASRGWYCHRRDGTRGDEDWHFNYFGSDAQRFLARASEDHASWTEPLEALIQERYGQQFQLAPRKIQAALARLNLYGGEIDGQIGPLTEEAVRAFQRAWTLTEDGVAGPVTQRVLALASAEIWFD